MIRVTKQGRISEAIHGALQAALGSNKVHWICNARFGDPNDLIVAAVDGCQLERLHHWQRVAAAWKLSLFCVHIHGGEAVIGPVIRIGQPGCLECWSARYFSGRAVARRFTEMASLCDGDSLDDPWLTPLTVPVVGQLAALRILDASRKEWPSDHWECNVYYLNLRNLTGREWQLAPDPLCANCGPLPLDSAARAQLKLTRRPKPDELDDRLQTLPNLGWVRDAYTGRRANIIPDVNVTWPISRGAVVTVAVPLTEGRQPEPCSGFCHRYSDARTASILEGLERYSGVRPRAYRLAVHASVSSLRGAAIDPRKFGLHSEREYRANPELLTPYDDNLEIDFVWAHSFAERRPVLLPRQLGYYSLGLPERPLFVIEGSIGCAVGSCPEECLLHGIFEVVERDAFLLTWYAKLSRPRLDAMKCGDPEVRYHQRELERSGFEVVTLDITNDFGIPSILVAARRNDARMPHAACLSASHLRPERAIRKAFRELSAVVCRYEVELADSDTKRRALALADDPSKVRSMMDHALFYSVPESGQHLDFLFASCEKTSLEEMRRSHGAFRSSDLRDEVLHSIGKILDAKSDLLAVDQTAPEQRKRDLYTYKVLITGAVPMTWGEHLRRLDGLHRIEACGHAEHGPSGFVVNPAPHPYP